MLLVERRMGGDGGGGGYVVAMKRALDSGVWRCLEHRTYN